MQRQQAVQALEEQQAKIREINARASKLESEANAGAPGDGGRAARQMQAEVMHIRQQASQEIDRLSEQLRKAQADLANRTMQIRSDADTRIETARIDADAKQRVAEIQASSDRVIGVLQARLDELTAGVDVQKPQKESNPSTDAR